MANILPNICSKSFSSVNDLNVLQDNGDNVTEAGVDDQHKGRTQCPNNPVSSNRIHHVSGSTFVDYQNCGKEKKRLREPVVCNPLLIILKFKACFATRALSYDVFSTGIGGPITSEYLLLREEFKIKKE